MIEIGPGIPGQERMLVLAPHPDDESIAVGGLLLRAAAAGVPLRVVYLTSGDNNPWAQRATEGRWWIGERDRARWGARREGEARRALACLGAPEDSAVFLGFGDQRLTDLLAVTPCAPVTRLIEEIESWRPTTLLAPSLFDRHPDHSAAAVMTQVAVATTEPHLRPRVLTYSIHGPRMGRGSRTFCVPGLSPEERARKARAILCHASQLRLRRRYLLDFARRPETFEVDPREATPQPGVHPLRLAESTSAEWTFSFQAPARMAFDRATLLLVAQGLDGFDVLSLPMPRRPGRAAIRDDRGRAILGEVAAAAAGGHELMVTVASACLRHAEIRLAKVRFDWNRRLGFFDRWPWLSFGHADERPALPADEAADRLPAGARL